MNAPSREQDLSARDLEPILGLASKLAAPFDLETMLAEVVDAGTRVLHADRGSVWLYDRNMGQAPICLASGPLDGERTQQGNDQLAREWSRVRTRPNLTSCVDTDRHNGCSDF